MARILGEGSRINHPEHGKGVVVAIKADSLLVSFIEIGMREIEKDTSTFEVIEATAPRGDTILIEEVEKRLRHVIREISDIQETVSLSDKWKEGTLVLKAADAGLKPYEMPIETFFHKIVMVRDRLRVMEQRINSSKLDDKEKVNLQQYITRIYGSLTSFNILFKNRKEDFTGMRDEQE